MQTRSYLLLASPEIITTLVLVVGTELLQMSWSTKYDMRSKLVMQLLQPIVFH